MIIIARNDEPLAVRSSVQICEKGIAASHVTLALDDGNLIHAHKVILAQLSLFLK